MEVTGIRLTNTSAFVITARNKDNSEFYIRPKSDLERELELKKQRSDAFVSSALHEGVETEVNIIAMIEKGIDFYTYDYSNKTFTPVIIVGKNIKSDPNHTKEDNVGKLPLLS